MMPELEKLAEDAARVLRLQWKMEVALVEPTLLKDKSRSLVIRCHVVAPPPASPPCSGVIVKKMRTGFELGFNEWSGLAFLSGIPAARNTAPYFLGGDVAQQFFVMEDLGGSRSLEDILSEDSREAAANALRNLATNMARLHGVTREKELAFDAIRRNLPEIGKTTRREEAGALA